MAVQPGIIDIRTAQGHMHRQFALHTGTPVSTPALDLLLIEENPFTRRACGEISERMGFAVQTASTGVEVRRLLKKRVFDLVLLDLKVENGGLDLLHEIRKSCPQASVVVTTAYATVSSAVEAMRLGAVDYLTQPFAMDELTSVLDRVAQRVHSSFSTKWLRDKLRLNADGEGLQGSSPEMEKLYRMLAKVIPATLPVLILGEEGTGKKRVARWIHRSGPRAESRYVAVECGTATPEEIQAQIFGAAFEDSTCTQGALGLPGTTVFFDEIDRLPPTLQTRLLRAMQDRRYQPAVPGEPVPLQARILAGSRQDLGRMAETGAFRRDLYQRLNVVNLQMPSLRDRPSDIPELANYFLLEFGRNRDMSFVLSQEAMSLLCAYDWPGNVRELEAVLQRMAELASAPLLDLDTLSTRLTDFRRAREMTVRMSDARKPRLVPPSIGSYAAAPSPLPIAEQERRAILKTLEQMRGDKIMAAKVLGIGRTTLYRKLKTYGIGSTAL